MNFGSGTDPIEGSKLAISILEYFYNLHSTTISTTHYQELKEYTLTTYGFENASFEFDLNTLSPTYKLLLGIPGKSNAFEISKRLGLNENILLRAKSLMNSNDINIEDLLKEIYDNKIKVEKEKQEISKNLNQIEVLRKKLETECSSSEQKAILIVEKAKKEAQDILLDVKDEAAQIIKQMNSIKSKNSVQDLYDLKNDINDKLKSFSVNRNKSEKGNLSKEDVKIGLNVYVIPLGKNGIVSTLPNSSSEVELQIGTLKTNININQLVKLTNVPIKQKTISTKNSSNNLKSKTISNEINVIGLNVEESLSIIDKYLDDAKLSSLETIRIVHGKGTGKLRTGIHNFLKNHPHVKSYRIGNFGEGEMGVTVVTIK